MSKIVTNTPIGKVFYDPMVMERGPARQPMATQAKELMDRMRAPELFAEEKALGHACKGCTHCTCKK